VGQTVELSDLIGDVYDAALDRDRWPAVLESILSYIGGSFANLFSQDEAIKSSTVFYSYGIPPSFQESYDKKYIAINPLFPATLFFEVERVIKQEEIIAHSEFRQTRFYKEWAEPLGWLDAIAVVLEKSALSCSMLAIGRHKRDGLIDDGAAQRLQLLVPHVRRSLAIGRTIDLHKVEAASLADALDGLAAAMFLVTSSGRIVRANVSGQNMLAGGKVVRSVADKLTMPDKSADAMLHELLLSASDDPLATPKGAAIPVTADDGERFVAHILPLTSGNRRNASVAYSAAAAVFIRKATLETQHALESLAKAFNLTVAEMRVLMLIINVGGVPEVAPILGISEATIRTHLQHVFAKTGATRQADLVKLVAGYMSPITL
jgi:DNA-binding CsgD family transcriptional regulator